MRKNESGDGDKKHMMKVVMMEVIMKTLAVDKKTIMMKMSNVVFVVADDGGREDGEDGVAWKSGWSDLND